MLLQTLALLVTLTSTKQDLTLCTNLSSYSIHCNIVSLQDARDSTVDWSRIHAGKAIRHGIHYSLIKNTFYYIG